MVRYQTVEVGRTLASHWRAVPGAMEQIAPMLRIDEETLAKISQDKVGGRGNGNGREVHGGQIIGTDHCGMEWVLSLVLHSQVHASGLSYARNSGLVVGT